MGKIKWDISFKGVDSYSEEKLQRMKKRYPELTFSTYCFLQVCGLKSQEIIKLYEIPKNDFYFFKGNHYNVLSEVRGWQ